jgi:hypothetical protein
MVLYDHKTAEYPVNLPRAVDLVKKATLHPAEQEDAVLLATVLAEGCTV